MKILFLTILLLLSNTAIGLEITCKKDVFGRTICSDKGQVVTVCKTDKFGRIHCKSK